MLSNIRLLQESYELTQFSAAMLLLYLLARWDSSLLFSG